MLKNILIDAREFSPQKITGVGRVLIGLKDALSESAIAKNVTLAVVSEHVLPANLANRKNVSLKIIPSSFLASELILSKLTRQNTNLFISPYPKLPLFGVSCRSVHIVHDVMDLDHYACRGRFKTAVDKIRLKRALKKADITWYDSKHSLIATRELIGEVGNNPKVRYPGLGPEFDHHKAPEDDDVLHKYDLKSGYILMVGNGLPHKNLGAVLRISNKLDRNLVIIGVNEVNQKYWKSFCPGARAHWIDHVKDNELPTLLRNAFCLAQPSIEEGYGYPPLEAMACAVPAVVSHIPVLLETTGGNAITADPRSPEIWLKAFKDLENKNFYQDHVKMGLNWVQPLIGHKGWERQISDLTELM